MIERNSLFHLEFYRHTYFSGSFSGMRYRIERVKPESDDKPPEFLVTIFPGPYGFDATPAEKKEIRRFPFEENALDEICAWLNASYEKSPELWSEGRRIR